MFSYVVDRRSVLESVDIIHFTSQLGFQVCKAERVSPVATARLEAERKMGNESGVQDA